MTSGFGLGIDGAKSRYSLAVLEAVCAQGGATIDETRQDEDVWAIDAKVELTAGDVRVQLKCTASPNRTAEGIRIDLTDGWIEKWSNKRLPIYVVGVVVPKAQNEWIEHNIDSVIHHTQAYWARFDPDADRKSIVLPSKNRLNPATLTQWDHELNQCFEGG